MKKLLLFSVLFVFLSCSEKTELLSVEETIDNVLDVYYSDKYKQSGYETFFSPEFFSKTDKKTFIDNAYEFKKNAGKFIKREKQNSSGNNPENSKTFAVDFIVTYENIKSYEKFKFVKDTNDEYKISVLKIQVL